MPAIFDGDTLTITLEAPTNGVLELDVQIDLYSDWKEWVKTGSNTKYSIAFLTAGGDPLTAATDSGSYYFLRNDLGWRIKPFEADATIYVLGNLVPTDITLPLFLPTTGAYTVLALGLQPVVESVALLAELQRTSLTLAQYIALR